MAKLVIYRGDTLDREVELGPRTARIGRGDQNDIVLTDPGKSVSRFHAELRYENGKYAIADLNSQNGTWVAGKRVQEYVLEPGMTVVLGTYRLVLVADVPPPDGDRTIISTPAQPAATLIDAKPPVAPPPPKQEPPVPPKQEPPLPATLPPPQPAAVKPPEVKAIPPAVPAPPAPTPPRPPAPVAKTAPPPPSAPPKPPAPLAKTAPPPPVVPPPRPAAPAAAKMPEPVRAHPPKPGGKGGSRALVFGAIGLLLLLGVAAAGYFAWPLVRSRLAEYIPGLAPSPTAQVAEAPAGSPPQPVPAEPPAQPPSVAPVETPPPPAEMPAASTVPPTVARGATPRPPRRTSEKPADPNAAAAKPAPVKLSALLEQARAAMIKADYLAAIAGFEAILKVDPKYPEAAELLAVARGGARNAAQLAVDAGNKAEMSGDYAAAQKQYDRAAQLDPESSAPPEAIRRMKARMQGEGEDAFKKAKQYDALGRTQEAIAAYEKALQLLPADHANTKAARDRLAALRGGE